MPRVAVVQAIWNREITDALATAAAATAAAAGVTCERFEVSGAFELPAAVRALGEGGRYDAIVPIGCLVRGDTPHFQVLSDAVAAGLMQLSITLAPAVVFGVLTCDTIEQARARAGGAEGNKGAECMEAALGLIALRRKVKTQL